MPELLERHELNSGEYDSSKHNCVISPDLGKSQMLCVCWWIDHAWEQSLALRPGGTKQLWALWAAPHPGKTGWLHTSGWACPLESSGSWTQPTNAPEKCRLASAKNIPGPLKLFSRTDNCLPAPGNIPERGLIQCHCPSRDVQVTSYLGPGCLTSH